MKQYAFYIGHHSMGETPSESNRTYIKSTRATIWLQPLLPLPQNLPSYAKDWLRELEKRKFGNDFSGINNDIQIIEINTAVRSKENLQERLISIDCPLRGLGGARHFGEKGEVFAGINYVSEPLTKTQLALAKVVPDSDYYDIEELLRMANWKTFIELGAARYSKGTILPEEVRKSPPVSLIEGIEIQYNFSPDSTFTGLECNATLTPDELEISQRTENGKDDETSSLAPERCLRVWTPKLDGNQFQEEKDYDVAISRHFPAKNVPTRKELSDINLERMILEFAPHIIDAMIDFVEN